MKTNPRLRRGFDRRIKIYDAITSPKELLIESTINFSWGFFGNSIVLFMAKEIDMAVFINFVFYYAMISYIINRAKYRTKLGKLIILPGAAALGAYSGYKVAQYISSII